MKIKITISEEHPVNRPDSKCADSGYLLRALLDCVHVMERELKGLAVIQPELAYARYAIAKYQAEAAK